MATHGGGEVPDGGGEPQAGVQLLLLRRPDDEGVFARLLEGGEEVGLLAGADRQPGDRLGGEDRQAGGRSGQGGAIAEDIGDPRPRGGLAP